MKHESEVLRGNKGRNNARKRPCTACMDNIEMWTGLPVEESIRMTANRDKRRKYVHDMANLQIENG